ncbi:MAG: DMT family transporter [Verrucomicrobiota bacterium]
MAYIFLLIGVFACSTSVFFIKLSATDPIFLSAYRLFVAGFLLLPLARKASKKHPEYKVSFFDLTTLLPALFLSLHFISWIFGARLTPAANATLLVNMTPIVMPYLLFLLAKERLSLGGWIGTAFAISGIFILAGTDFNTSPQYFFGDIVCFLSMILFALYMALAKRNRTVPSIYLYIVPIYFSAGILCLGIGIPFLLFSETTNWIGQDFLKEIILILAISSIPTVLGHSILNWSMKHLPGQSVAVVNLAQFIFAGIMSFFVFEEIPQLSFYLAASLAIGGAIIVIYAAPKSPSAAQ